MKIKIEKGVKIPRKRGGRKGSNQYPFEDMEVGDSFFVPVKTNREVRNLQSQVLSAAKSYAANHRKYWSFRTSGTPDGVRIWRTK